MITYWKHLRHRVAVLIAPELAKEWEAVYEELRRENKSLREKGWEQFQRILSLECKLHMLQKDLDHYKANSIYLETRYDFASDSHCIEVRISNAQVADHVWRPTIVSAAVNRALLAIGNHFK